VLFAIMCVVWGIPYLLIKVAVEGVAVPVVVFGRTALGAALLLLTIAASFVLVLGGSLLASSRQGGRLPSAEPIPGADPDHLPADRT
jgi:hypothetical protein